MTAPGFCEKCQHERSKDARFCPKCGCALVPAPRNALGPATAPRKKTSTWWIVLIVALMLGGLHGLRKGLKERRELESTLNSIKTADELFEEQQIHWLEQQRRLRLSNGNPELYRELSKEDQRARKRSYGRD